MITDEDVFEELEKRYNNFLKVNETNYKERLLKLPYMISTVTSVYRLESEEMKRLESQRKAIFGSKINYYKYDSPRAYTGKEIEYMIWDNPDYKSIVDQLNKQVSLVEYLESWVQTLRDLSYAIKTALDIRKFEAGEK